MLVLEMSVRKGLSRLTFAAMCRRGGGDGRRVVMPVYLVPIEGVVVGLGVVSCAAVQDAPEGGEAVAEGGVRPGVVAEVPGGDSMHYVGGWCKGQGGEGRAEQQHTQGNDKTHTHHLPERTVLYPLDCISFPKLGVASGRWHGAASRRGPVIPECGATRPVNSATLVGVQVGWT